jgi:hypothetical protein
MQSPSPEQSVRHAVMAALHWYGAQGRLAPPKLQVPLPSHSTCALAVPFLHDAGLQRVPDGYRRQADPSDLHEPFCPHEAAPMSAHGVWQQMPITQLSFAHCALEEQLLPSGFSAHTPPWQSPP